MSPNDNIRPVPECSALATDWRGGFPVEAAHAGLWRCIADAECGCGHCPDHCACPVDETIARIEAGLPISLVAFRQALREGALYPHEFHRLPGAAAAVCTDCNATVHFEVSA